MSYPVYTAHPSEMQGSDALAELALDLRWTWNRSAHELWGRLDPDLWDRTQNPWVILQTISREKLQTVASDPEFQRRVNELLLEKRAADESAAWFQTAYPASPLKLAAYFSMEYMLSEALPIYSGGLGNVAGDQLKACSDLGIPVAGIGLLYQQGYFRQQIDQYGNQLALYPFNDPWQLPIMPLRGSNGEWVRFTLKLPGFDLWVRAWQVKVGRRVLYLLDSNDPANPPAYRSITGELYGGGSELRIRQEIILGIGGWRLIEMLGLNPEVCHLNEGHAAFAVLERARSVMRVLKQPFDVALTASRAGNIFTTHTPVEAGFDRFAPELMARYLRPYAEDVLGIRFRDLMALGRKDADDDSEPFNMAYLAMRGSAQVNGVSRLHGEVSRRIFQPLFPRWPEHEVPVGHVTNGVHVPTWESEKTSTLWTAACGYERWLGNQERVGPDFRAVCDRDLWQFRHDARKSLLEYARMRFARQCAEQGACPEDVDQAGRIFDFDTLTMGFARRFATYKRPNLLLHDPDRLARILTDRARPVQLILAGKAHPQDRAGQAMLREWVEFERRPDIRGHVVFLSDYDMLLTEQLVQGVDLWINTPRRPWEASGTSGMKILVNGGLNLSELDGWWAEAYAADVGWAIGDRQEHGEDPAWDAAEANALYELLEREVVPAFYSRNAEGIPPAWVARMRESMARLTPLFSANRVVRQYTEMHYLAAAAAYLERVADGGKLAAEVRDWQRALAASWSHIRFGAVSVETRGGRHIFEVQVFLDELAPDLVRVELYADPLGDGEPVRQEMMRTHRLAASGGHLYRVQVPSTRPARDYTPRLLPAKARAFVPLEAPQILWQR
jgi:starch phosphorylase